MPSRSSRALQFVVVLVALLLPSLISAEENPFEKTIQKFEAQDAANPPGPGRIIFYGSSSIVFWKTAEDFPDLNVLNRGFGGSVTSDALLFADRVVIKHKPRIVVFYEGDNDLASDMAPQEVFEDIQTFFHKVHRDSPDTKIIYVAIKPSIARWNLIDKIRETNKMVRDYAAENPHVHFLDVEPIMLGADGKPKPELFIDDGLHLSRAGYDEWNKLIRPLLTEK
jgi:lysophospholipase L1-like esterase